MWATKFATRNPGYSGYIRDNREVDIVAKEAVIIQTTQMDLLKTKMDLHKDRTIVASYVNGDRDGIGIEIYRDNKLVIEIFRDDSKQTRTVTVFDKETSLELLLESIEIFKKEIPWDFIN